MQRARTRGRAGWARMALLVVAATAMAGSAPPPSTASPAAPEVILWAWHRAEDLRFLPPGSRVAALVGTLELRGGTVAVEPRLQSLRLPAQVTVLPVVRVEVSRADPPQLTPAQAAAAAAAVARLARGGAVQLDFDAAVSQRAFQRAFVAALRERLPPPSSVSVTALASTCLDGTAATVGADEVVPMLFRLGPDGRPLLRRVARHGLPAPCAAAVGIATDEPLRAPASAARVFLFAPRSWDRALLDRARSEILR